MLTVKYKLRIGQDEFELSAEVKNEKEFFQKMAFYSSLPKTAPKGATDLQLVVRETAKGTYYSLISETEQVEFQLGQHKEGDSLYAKDWVPLYQKDQPQHGATTPAFGTQPTQAPQQAPVQTAPAFGQFPGMVPPTQGPTAAPVQPATPPQAPTMPAFGNQPVTTPAATAPVAPTIPAIPTTAPAAPAVSPQTQAIAGNVLSRFGIKSQ